MPFPKTQPENTGGFKSPKLSGSVAHEYRFKLVLQRAATGSGLLGPERQGREARRADKGGFSALSPHGQTHAVRAAAAQGEQPLQAHPEML